MRTIHKYILSPYNEKVDMLAGAKILHVGVQRGAICIWAEVDTSAKFVERRFGVYGTGHTMPTEPGKYIGTVMLADGDLVFHIYERV